MSRSPGKIDPAGETALLVEQVHGDGRPGVHDDRRLARPAPSDRGGQDIQEAVDPDAARLVHAHPDRHLRGRVDGEDLLAPRLGPGDELPQPVGVRWRRRPRSRPWAEPHSVASRSQAARSSAGSPRTGSSSFPLATRQNLTRLLPMSTTASGMAVPSRRRGGSRVRPAAGEVRLGRPARGQFVQLGHHLRHELGQALPRDGRDRLHLDAQFAASRSRTSSLPVSSDLLTATNSGLPARAGLYSSSSRRIVR